MSQNLSDRFLQICRSVPIATSIGLVAPAFGQNPLAPSHDPYIWLEDLRGSNSTVWIEAENKRTLDRPEKDSLYVSFYRDALAIAAVISSQWRHYSQ